MWSNLGVRHADWSIEKQTIAAVVYATHNNGMNKLD